MLKPLPLVLMAAIALAPACSRSVSLPSLPSAASSDVAAAAPFNYDAYTALLAAHVDGDGLVDYDALQSDRALLDAVVAELGQVSFETYAAWDEADRIAFLINAYNAITLQSIIDQQPLKASIRNIPGVWNGRQHAVLGQALTLDNIEHDILRKDFAEPRIHAALVCAAISCPPLRQDAFTGDRLDDQLNDQTQRWLAGPHGVAIDRAQNRVAISSIFKWFGDDWLAAYAAPDQFTGSPQERAVLNFIGDYLDPEDAAFLAAGDYRLGYLDYDWSLNQQ